LPNDQYPGEIPLANILRAANDLVRAGLIEDWDLGGALAAIYYVEPFTTYDADIFFIPSDKGLIAGLPAMYAHLLAQGWRIEREHLILNEFPVQFLATNGLTEEAVREAERIEFEAIPAKVFRPDILSRSQRALDGRRTKRVSSNFFNKSISTKLDWKKSWRNIT